MIVDVDSPAFEELIDPAAELTELGSGYQFTEGPVWNPRDQSLYFSDIPGDARWRWSDGGRDGDWWPCPRSRATAWRTTSMAACSLCEQVSQLSHPRPPVAVESWSHGTTRVST